MIDRVEYPGSSKALIRHWVRPRRNSLRTAHGLLPHWSSPFKAQYLHTPPSPILMSPAHAALLPAAYALSLLHLKFYSKWAGWEGEEGVEERKSNHGHYNY